MLEWYDTWLKGENTGIDKTRTPMHLYELASNRWVNTASYPIVSDYTTYHLNSEATLTPSRPTTVESDTIVWTQPTAPEGSLSYTTPPFADGATLAGPISAEVYAQSSNTNLELIATLLDVAPDGTETPITFGAVLGSQRALDPGRNWYDKEGTLIRPYTSQLGDDFLTPAQTQLFAIALHPRLWSVAPGHALRVRFTTQSLTSDCAGFNILPCGLTAPAQATVPGGVYELQRSPTWPSAVNLPLLPYRCLDTVASGTTPTSGTNTQPLDWSSRRARDLLSRSTTNRDKLATAPATVSGRRSSASPSIRCAGLLRSARWTLSTSFSERAPSSHRPQVGAHRVIEAQVGAPNASTERRRRTSRRRAISASRCLSPVGGERSGLCPSRDRD